LHFNVLGLYQTQVSPRDELFVFKLLCLEPGQDQFLVERSEALGTKALFELSKANFILWRCLSPWWRALMGHSGFKLYLDNPKRMSVSYTKYLT